MADTPSGINTPTLGALKSGLGAYNGRSSSSSGSSSGGSRTNQFVSLNLTDFLDTDVDDYERRAYTNPEDVEISHEVDKPWYEKLWDAAKSTAATIVVGATSIISGALDVVEGVVDGVVTGAAYLLDVVGADDLADGAREFVKRDMVTELNDAVYGEGGILQGVNDASYFKYDSEEMLGVRSVGKKVTVFVAATAATVCTGGAASVVLPLALGMAYGSGEKAEELYNEHGIHLSDADKWKIVLSGAAEAFNWYGMGKMGSQALSFTKGAWSAGFKGVRSNFKTLVRGVQNFDWGSAVKAAGKTATSMTTLKATAAQQAPYVINLVGKAIDGEEITTEDWIGLGLNTFKSYATTVGFGAIGGGVGGGINKYQRTRQFMDDQGKIFGVKQGTLDQYDSALQADAQKSVSWEVMEKAKINKAEWDALTPKEQAELTRSVGLGAKVDSVLADKYQAAGHTIHQYGVQEHKGFYDSGYSLDKVLEAKINKTSGQKSYAGIRNAEFLPNADEFVSDDRVLDYIKEICPNDPEIAKCRNLQEAADVLAKGKTGKFVTFQSAGIGDSNVVKYGGNFGYVADDTAPYGGYEGSKTGGPFMTTAAELERYAKQYPDYCKIDNGQFVITNMEKFGKEALGGVTLSDAAGSYMIEVEVPINGQNITMPSVSNTSSYMAEFVSGGKLPSGGTEITTLPVNLQGITNAGISGQTGVGVTEITSSLKTPQVIKDYVFKVTHLK